jgi:hypothetical protein
MELQSISGEEAIRRARALKGVPNAYFMLMHLTCNLKSKESGEMSKTERCRCRPVLREDTFQTDGDHYFTYEDLDTEQPKMCFKKLMRYIAFPPEYELLKITWFDE